MVKAIMHGCNGKMGQVISNLAAADSDIEIVAGIDPHDDGHNAYPVYRSIFECDIPADVIIDFAAAGAVNNLLDYAVRKNIPVVLCTTGLSAEQLDKVEETAQKVAVLKSANMSLGINTLFKVLASRTRSAGAARICGCVLRRFYRRPASILRLLRSTTDLRWMLRVEQLWHLQTL